MQRRARLRRRLAATPALEQPFPWKICLSNHPSPRSPTFLKSSLVRLRPMASMSRPTPHSNCCVVIQLRLAGRKKAVHPEMSACGLLSEERLVGWEVKGKAHHQGHAPGMTTAGRPWPWRVAAAAAGDAASAAAPAVRCDASSAAVASAARHNCTLTHTGNSIVATSAICSSLLF